MTTINIIYESPEILVLDKPFGLAVQGGRGITRSLDEELSMQLGYKIFLVHRLDRETSGLMVVAKSSRYAAKWTGLLNQAQVKKEYCALCIGRPSPNSREGDTGVIDSVMEAHGKKVTAQTFWTLSRTGTVEIAWADSDGNETVEQVPMSLFHLRLGTGRMHQIRIQMASIGCPLAADDQHGNFRLNKLVRKIGIKKLQLMSQSITIPVDGKPRTFTVPLAGHIQEAVDRCFGNSRG